EPGRVGLGVLEAHAHDRLVGRLLVAGLDPVLRAVERPLLARPDEAAYIGAIARLFDESVELRARDLIAAERELLRDVHLALALFVALASLLARRRAESAGAGGDHDHVRAADAVGEARHGRAGQRLVALALALGGRDRGGGGGRHRIGRLARARGIG